ncbi:MAG: hypothetical protein IZT55_05495 [Anaerolineae bacterium]|nr:hypothetical protein [Anaerolineae bacterium]
MTNGDQGDALLRELLNSISIEYDLVQNNTSLYVSFALLLLLVLFGMLNRRRRISQD